MGPNGGSVAMDSERKRPTMMMPGRVRYPPTGSKGLMAPSRQQVSQVKSKVNSRFCIKIFAVVAWNSGMYRDFNGSL